MDKPEISKDEQESFIEAIRLALSDSASMDDVVGWLNSKPFVTRVHAADYLIKTEPPKMEIIITMKMEEGIDVTKVIDIVVHPDQSMELAGVHDP